MKYVAFLRAINVGGHVVTMDQLKKLFVGLGFRDAETFIASGNVVFSSTAKGTAALEQKIEAGLEKKLGYEVRTFLRSGAEVATIAAGQPFKPAVMKAATVINVGFMAEPLSAEQVKTLLGYRCDVDEFAAVGREVYWLCRTRSSESPFFKVRFEKVVGAAVSFRNMNTVVRLTDKYGFAG